MRYGIAAGITWALETVLLGAALGMPFFSTDARLLFLAPFIATFLHDLASALYTFAYNIIKGNRKDLWRLCRSRRVLWLVLASAIGGPIGMTGYVLAVNYMGASVGAVASAVYPAIGTALAAVFLKEKTKWYQWVFLALTMLGVYGLSYSPTLDVASLGLGLLGAFMCAFGWGTEAVILAKCLKDADIKSECALGIRQATSALIYGLILLPIFGGWGETVRLFTDGGARPLLTVAAAALCATVSYLLYYKAIERRGAAKAMALNITYTAWAILFSLLLFKDTSVLNPLTLSCGAAIVICGILAATDLDTLRGRRARTTRRGVANKNRPDDGER